MGSDENEAFDTLTAEEPGGFTQVPDSLLLNTDVSDGAYRLYAVLKHHARQKTTAFPRRRVLARELGVSSVRTVDGRIKELKKAGYLTVTAQFHDEGGQRSNKYHLRFYPVQNSAPPPGTELHGPGAADCAAGAHGTAGQRSTSLEDTPTPTSSRKRGRPATVSGSATRFQRIREHRSEEADRNAEAKAGDGGGSDERYLEEFLAHLPAPLLPRSRTQRSALGALLAGPAQVWSATDLVDALVVGRPLPESVTHPIGLLRSRLEQLPERRAPRRWPDWCGLCDERTRLVHDEEADTVGRCPHCHPSVAPQTKESA